MVLVFLYLIFGLLILNIILLLSIIKVRIENLYIYKTKKINKIQWDKVKVEIWLFNKIKIFSIKFENKKINTKKIVNRFDINKKLKNKLNIKNIWEDLKLLNIKLKFLDINMKVGVEDVIGTSFIVTLLASLIAIIASHIIKNNNFKYKIEPIYNMENILNLKLDCIIEIKIVNIIHIVFKRKRDGKFERTSNRRTYEYSYE